MSPCPNSKVEVVLYGAGCASLSLAARASELGSHKIKVIAPTVTRLAIMFGGFGICLGLRGWQTKSKRHGKNGALSLKIGW